MHISDFHILDGDEDAATFRIKERKGHVGELWAIIDADRIPDLLKFKAFHQHDFSRHGYRAVCFDGRKSRYLHRILLGDPGKGNHWCCLSGNPLDCRAANWEAKPVGLAKNLRDTYLDADGLPKSVYRNVTFEPGCGGWTVTYTEKQIKHYVGTFGFAEACRRSQEISIRLGRKVFPLPSQEEIDHINELFGTAPVIVTHPRVPDEIRRAILDAPEGTRVIDMVRQYGIPYPTCWQIRYRSKK